MIDSSDAPLPTHELLVSYSDSYCAFEAYSIEEAKEIWKDEVAKGAMQTALYAIRGRKRTLIRVWDRRTNELNQDHYIAMREVARLTKQLKAAQVLI